MGVDDNLFFIYNKYHYIWRNFNRLEEKEEYFISNSGISVMLHKNPKDT